MSSSESTVRWCGSSRPSSPTMRSVCSFSERGRGEPEFLPSELSEAAIAGVCARVDHLPLGIELAAARIGVMSPEEILASLDTDLAGLGALRRVAPARQQTLWATVDWSYRLLDPFEQAAFRSLSVFVGGVRHRCWAVGRPGPVARVAGSTRRQVADRCRGDLERAHEVPLARDGETGRSRTAGRGGRARSSPCGPSRALLGARRRQSRRVALA